MIINTAVLMENMKFILKLGKVEEKHPHNHYSIGWGLNTMNQSINIEYVEGLPK